MTGDAFLDGPVLTFALLVSHVILLSALLHALVFTLQLGLAGWDLLKTPRVRKSNVLWQRFSESAPPIAIVVPAFNEGLNIVHTVRSLMSLEYPNYEIIVVNDGSTDGSLETLAAEFRLSQINRPYEQALKHEPIKGIYGSKTNNRLIVVDKFNGGKSDAQNAGVNLSRAPLFCIIDGDSILEVDALLRLVQPFIEDPDRMIAAGGTVRIANNCVIDKGRVEVIRTPRKLVPLFQVVEYLRSFLMARLAWSRIDTLMLISGAFGLFRRDVVMEVGGYHAGSLGEDLDMVVKLHKRMIEQKRDYKISFLSDPVCWTEAPEDLNTLSKQRRRWQRGAMECFFRYKSMFLNPRYGRIGMIGMPHIFLIDIAGPILEVLGYLLIPTFWFLGVLDTEYFLAWVALVFVFGIFVSVCSLVLEELGLRRFQRKRDLVILTVAAVLENFGYRQLNNIWRLRGLVQYATGDTSWGEMTRVGLGSQAVEKPK